MDNSLAVDKLRALLASKGLDPDALISALQDKANVATQLADRQASYKEVMQPPQNPLTPKAVIEAEGEEDQLEIGLEPNMKAYMDKRMMELESKMADMVKSMMSDYEAKMAALTAPKPADDDMSEIKSLLKNLNEQKNAQTMQTARVAGLLGEQAQMVSQQDAYKSAGLDVGFYEFLNGAR